MFQQVVLLAQEVGLVDFRRAAFDGTRVKANNRRSGSRTAAQLHSERAASAKLFDELEAVAAREDAERVAGGEAQAANPACGCPRTQCSPFPPPCRGSAPDCAGGRGECTLITNLIAFFDRPSRSRLRG